MQKQVKFWKISKMTAKPKVMENVMESHWIWRTQKSANPELIKDQAFSTLMITSLILITCSFDDVLVLWGENWYWSVFGLKKGY